MTLPVTPETRLARARHPDEETRYLATAELDLAHPDERAELLARLSDESWRVRAAAVERLSASPEPAAILADVLRQLDASPTPGGRSAAAAVLTGLGPSVVAPLVERLGGDDPERKLAALSVLGALGERRVVPALAARLADADANVRAAAAEALGKLGGPEAAAGLTAALDSDDRTLQLAALEALASMGLAPPAYRLSRLMGDRALRPAAYRALGCSEEPSALELLADGPSERSRSVREAALGAVGQQRSRRGLEGLGRLAQAVRGAAARDPAVADGSLAALSSEEPFVALGALTVLGWIGEARHAAALARLADDDRYRPAVEEALEALPAGTEALAVLSQVLPELSPLARITVHGALAAAGSASSLQALVYGTGDADPQVQAEAVAALGRVGDPRAVGSLAGLLGDDLPALAGVAASALTRVAHRAESGRTAVLLECRARAAARPSAALYRILGAVGEREDIRLVRDGLSGGDVVRRMAAAGAVASLGHRGLLRGEHVPELIAALRDPAWSVRAAAARAFVELAQANIDRRLGDPSQGEHPICAHAIQALQGVLEDEEPAVRAAAVEALGACGRAEHGPAIRRAGTAPDAAPVVVVAALHALARLGELSAGFVAGALRHADPEVVKEAVLAAGRLDGPEAVPLLLTAATSERWDVRLAAAHAIGARPEPALRQAAYRLAARDADPLVARAFEEAARSPRGAQGR